MGIIKHLSAAAREKEFTLGSFLYADGMDPWAFVDPAVHP
jgi:hypothetical protein